MSKEGTRPAQGPHRWEFKARFRRRAFGWRSQAAIQRVKEAVKEIRKAARRDPILGAEGAVLFLERVSGALEQVDSSSGAIGAAVNRAIEELVPIVAGAPAGAEKRQQWLERLFEAHADDGIPYIELLADHWGELCASKEVASAWADELIDITRMALGPDPDLRGHFHGATACLSALYRAERYEELVNVLEAETFWAYERWAVKALGAMGRKAEAIRLAEASRGPGTNDADVDRLCEEILLSSGLVEEAYTRYGLHMRRGTYLATFRALAKRYPTKEREEILADLVREVPGEEGKWFATAKDLGLYHLAVRLAWTSPCDPRTLTRAARDHLDEHTEFALESGCAALHWLAQGYGYEITSGDVHGAYAAAMKAARALGREAETKERVRKLVAGMAAGGFIAQVLGRELERERHI